MDTRFLPAFTAAWLVPWCAASADVVIRFYQDGANVVAVATGDYTAPPVEFRNGDDLQNHGYGDYDPADPVNTLKVDGVYDEVHDAYFDPPGRWPRTNLLTAMPDFRTGGFFGFYGPFLMVPAEVAPGATFTPDTRWTWSATSLGDLGLGALTTTPVQVWSAGNWTGTISYALGEGSVPEPGGGDQGDTPATALHISGNSLTAGEISGESDLDYFRIEVTSGGTLTAWTSGETDTYGTVYDEFEFVLAEDDDSGENSNFEVVVDLEPGVHYIGVWAYDAGPYQLHCSFTGETTNPPGGGGASGPPVLTGVDGFTPDPVDVTAGEASVTVEFGISDGDDGFSYGNVFLYNSTGNWVDTHYFDASQRVSGNDSNGTYRVQLPIPPHAPPGEWRIGLWLVDDGGEEREYTDYATPFPHPGEEIFTVLNSGTVDATPPVLNSFSISPQTVDASGGPAEITVALNVTDDLSKIGGITLWLYDPGGAFRQARSVATDVPGGDFTQTLTLPQGSAEGTWKVRLSVRDAVGNTMNYGLYGSPYPSPGQEEFKVGPVPTGTFAKFITLHNLTGADALPGANPDADPFSNALELLLGLNPTQPDHADPARFGVVRDGGLLHLDFTIDPALTVQASGDFLHISADGGEPLRVTGQTGANLRDDWVNQLPVARTGTTYRVTLPLSPAGTGAVRLAIEVPAF